MNKDWTGDKNSVYKTLGASSHAERDRAEDDFYATDPKAAELLLEVETFNHNIWEPAAGAGHLSKVFVQHGYNVISTDLIDRGYGEVYDFLQNDDSEYEIDIITNPPYRLAYEFLEQSLKLVKVGCKVAMFLKIQFLETQKRKLLFQKYPIKTVYVSSSRIECALNGNFIGSSAVAYGWFIWVKGYTGETVLKWIN